ncbi:hypothetical protein BH09BAC1_BH09BAC1_29940 [soil metagenome]
MNTNRPFYTKDDKELLRQELETVSPLLAKVAKPIVPMPADGYFETLADVVSLEASFPTEQPDRRPKRIFKLMPTATILAVAASIALAIIFWPTANVATTEEFALATLTYNELVQLALQDDELLYERMVDDQALVDKLDENIAFQYLAPADDGEGEYNKLLLELIDDETLMEDW